MKFIKNEGIYDRMIRVFVSECIFIGAFFWATGTLQVILYGISIIVLLTSIFGYCGLYSLVGINTCEVKEKVSKTAKFGFVIAFVLIAGLESYSSIFFSTKFFLEDYSVINQSYKQTLFFTGQEKRDESIKNYIMFTDAYTSFASKYSAYHPYRIAQDQKFNTDIASVAIMIANTKENVMTGNLKSAHTSLEQVRPVFQDILKRNGFSMLAISLVDFHDAMEKIIASADEKNVAQIIIDYSEVSAKLSEVEAIANDTEIQAIRKNLEDIYVLAKNNSVENLSAKAAELKSSFVKVYLKRG